MTSYQKLVSAFQRVGLFEDSLISQHQMKQALDRLANQNARMHEFDPEVAEELWGETPKQAGSNVYVRDYINTVLKGQQILRNEIDNTEKEIQRASNESEKMEKINDLNSYSHDHRYLTEPFGISRGRESAYVDNSRMSASRRSGVSSTSVIFTKAVGKTGGKATDLKFVFLFCVIGLLAEGIVMFHKHHFFSLLALMAVLSIYFLNYFDYHYMRFVLVVLALSVIFDLLWVFVHTGDYWSPDAQTEHSNVQDGFLKFIVIIVIGGAILKAVILAILLKYRENDPYITKQPKIFGNTFTLTGSPDSPIANIFLGSANNNQFYGQ